MISRLITEGGLENPMTDTTHYYRPDDSARILCHDCEGCGECCRGMGDTIALDPWDACMLSGGLGRPFAELINKEVSLRTENGIIVPYLSMKGAHEACSFLSGEGRCGIYAFRPGICRLYPLARKYAPEGVRYFILPDPCKGHAMNTVRIRDYLEIADYGAYEHFKAEWFRFLRDAENAAGTLTDPAAVEKLALFLFETFYLRPYERDSFHAVFEKRLRRTRRFLERLRT